MRGRAADGDAQTEADKDAQAQVYWHVAQPRAGDKGGRACGQGGAAAVHAGGGDGDAEAEADRPGDASAGGGGGRRSPSQVVYFVSSSIN